MDSSGWTKIYSKSKFSSGNIIEIASVFFIESTGWDIFTHN